MDPASETKFNRLATDYYLETMKCRDKINANGDKCAEKWRNLVAFVDTYRAKGIEEFKKVK